ncbi:MAG: CRISPR system precrRNA processing endoribonuclease RAMP protein Cas6 [Anaerolineae bacterium]|jgi:CRISPR-associated endoribonuclease Cas6|nr:CRISPR system precrRNA processing endoribonuclease RAMP protein Cas6 [Anaerolineae bacterium]
MDLLSLVLTLRPTAAGTPPPRLGRAAHAILLRQIAAQDAALAETLHNDEGPKPLTCSDLLGSRRREQVIPDETYILRYTALTAPVAATLANAFAIGQTLTFEDVAFEIINVAAPLTVSPPAPANPQPPNPWIGSDSYQDLAARHLLPAGPLPPTSWSILLAAPLAFQSRGKTQPLPLPELFFGSLVQRWNTFAPVALPEEGVRRYAEELVAVSRFELRSAPGWNRGPGLRIGAIGKITYRALNRDRYWLAVLSLLAEYALYAGAGAMTTSGMGQVRLLDVLQK